MMEEIRGRVAVVTGAGSGIGRALAHCFASQGMSVVLADIDSDGLAATVAQLEVDGAEVLTVPTDVSDPVQVEALAEASFDRFGTVHVVCNNAGVGTPGLLWEFPVEEWRWILGVNLFGVVHGIRAFVPRLVEQGEGHVVNTASTAGLISGPFAGPYSASKHAVVSISETLALDLQAIGSPVGVSVLCPGFVRTPILVNSANRRPAGPYDVPADTPLGAFFHAFSQMVDAGMDPATVAAMVLDAIVSRRFYVLTDPEAWKGAVEARMRGILDQTPAASVFG